MRDARVYCSNEADLLIHDVREKRDTEMKTRDRIIETARTLFNSSDIQSVTTNHIAAAAEVSPGNLYYHFKDKQEIIRALFDEMIASESRTCDRSSVCDFDTLYEFFSNLMDVYWHYRFLKREIVALAQRDPILKQRIVEYQKQQSAEIDHSIRQFIQRGLVVPVDEQRITSLTRALSLVLTFYLSHVEFDVGEMDGEAIVRQGVSLMANLIEPYRIQVG